jgi:anti-sigma-K factor RskA
MEESKKAAMKIIRILEAENADLNKTVLAKQKHIVALEKEIKRISPPKTFWAAINERISGIGRRYDHANGKGKI